MRWTFNIALLLSLLASPLRSQAQGLSGAYNQDESLTVEEKIKKSTTYIEQMKSTLRFALKKLEKARQEEDIIRINCVNDKLSAIKGLLKISEQAEVNLREAAVKKEAELINHEFTKISIAAVRVEGFRAEVEGCVGEVGQYTGETIVNVIVDKEIRNDDPTDGELTLVFDTIESDRPAAVTGSE